MGKKCKGIADPYRCGCQGPLRLAHFLATEAPILAAMIDGTESTPNTTTPRGNRLPGPCEKSIQINCPTSGRIPHLHERSGAKNANAMDIKHTAGSATEKYKPESHASFRPDASVTAIQTAAPQTTATRYSQWSLFIRSPFVFFLS